jgi:hypothetical protein
VPLFIWNVQFHFRVGQLLQLGEPAQNGAARRFNGLAGR